MPIKQIHQNSIIPNEPGILKKGNGGFHTPSPFAIENLAYVLWSDDYRCSSRYHLKREHLDAYLLLYLYSGSMVLEYQNKTYQVPKGSILFLNLRKPHRYYARSEIRMQQYMVDGPLTKAYYEKLYDHQGPLFTASGVLPQSFALLQEEMEQLMPDDNRINYLLLRIYSKMLLPEKQQMNPIVSQALQYFHKHYSEDISLDVISQEVSLSKYHFCRIFKEETGVSPHSYLSDLRIRQAKIFLTETDHSIEKISSECGFTSSSHFIRAFKAGNNSTPAQFRKQFQLFDNAPV